MYSGHQSSPSQPSFSSSEILRTTFLFLRQNFFTLILIWLIPFALTFIFIQYFFPDFIKIFKSLLSLPAGHSQTLEVQMEFSKQILYISMFQTFLFAFAQSASCYVVFNSFRRNQVDFISSLKATFPRWISVAAIIVFYLLLIFISSMIGLLVIFIRIFLALLFIPTITLCIIERKSALRSIQKSFHIMFQRNNLLVAFICSTCVFIPLIFTSSLFLSGIVQGLISLSVVTFIPLFILVIFSNLMDSVLYFYIISYIEKMNTDALSEKYEWD